MLNCKQISDLALTFPALCFSTVSEIEESMLSALRFPELVPPTPLPPPPPSRMSSDPSLLPPDRLHVEMELSPDSHITLYGPLLRALVSIKVHTLYLLIYM